MLKIKSSTECKILRTCEIKSSGSPFVLKCSLAALQGLTHLCSLNVIPYIVSHDFTAARNVQSLKQRVKLHTAGVFWSVFLICVFDLSILFEALSSSFPPHFNKDKTESRIVAAKSLSHENMESFMSSVEWKIKLIYFCSPWVWDNIARLNAFSLLSSACLRGPAHALAHTVRFIISAAIECVLSTQGPPACRCVSGRRCQECVHGHQVCVFIPSVIRQLRVDVSYSRRALCVKKEQRCLSRYTSTQFV